MSKMKLCALALILPVPLSGCATGFVATAENLCKDWRHQTVSKDDKLTDKTASQVEASNESRVNWGFEAGKNKAKS